MGAEGEAPAGAGPGRIPGASWLVLLAVLLAWAYEATRPYRPPAGYFLARFCCTLGLTPMGQPEGSARPLSLSSSAFARHLPTVVPVGLGTIKAGETLYARLENDAEGFTRLAELARQPFPGVPYLEGVVRRLVDAPDGRQLPDLHFPFQDCLLEPVGGPRRDGQCLMWASVEVAPNGDGRLVHLQDDSGLASR